jgi:hypothetical protein
MQTNEKATSRSRRARRIAGVAAVAGIALAVLLAIPMAGAGTKKCTPHGRYISGDFHNHTYLTDGNYPETTVVQKAFEEYGLDWMANSEHGGQFDRKPDGTKFPTPVWRWLTLSHYSYPIIQQLRLDYPEKGLIQGVEWNVPTHEHASVGIVGPSQPASISDFEYQFDQSDGDTSRAGEGLVKKNATHADAVAGAAWLQANYKDKSYFVINHPSRKLKYSAAQIRDFINAGPDVTIGLEGMPGHQAEPGRGGYGSGPFTDAAGNDITYKARTYGGADYMVAKVGGLWDSLLGEGRHFWTFVNSDFHSDFWGTEAADFWPGEYAKQYTYAVGDGLGAIVRSMQSGNTFSVHGDLIDSLRFEARAPWGADATMGQTLKVRKNAVVTVSIKFHSPARNNNGDLPKVDHVDLVAGDVTAPAAPGTPEYAADTNPSTKVVTTFDADDWWKRDGSYRVSFRVKAEKDMYVRLRGTNQGLSVAGETDAQGNPLMDAAPNTAAAAWADLWFYSNPIFIDVQLGRKTTTSALVSRERKRRGPEGPRRRLSCLGALAGGCRSGSVSTVATHMGQAPYRAGILRERHRDRRTDTRGCAGVYVDVDVDVERVLGRQACRRWATRCSPRTRASGLPPAHRLSRTSAVLAAGDALLADPPGEALPVEVLEEGLRVAPAALQQVAETGKGHRAVHRQRLLEPVAGLIHGRGGEPEVFLHTHGCTATDQHVEDQQQFAFLSTELLLHGAEGRRREAVGGQRGRDDGRQPLPLRTEHAGGRMRQAGVGADQAAGRDHAGSRRGHDVGRRGRRRRRREPVGGRVERGDRPRSAAGAERGGQLREGEKRAVWAVRGTALQDPLDRRFERRRRTRHEPAAHAGSGLDLLQDAAVRRLAQHRDGALADGRGRQVGGHYPGGPAGGGELGDCRRRVGGVHGRQEAGVALLAVPATSVGIEHDTAAHGRHRRQQAEDEAVVRLDQRRTLEPHANRRAPRLGDGRWRLAGGPRAGRRSACGRAAVEHVAIEQLQPGHELAGAVVDAELLARLERRRTGKRRDPGVEDGCGARGGGGRGQPAAAPQTRLLGAAHVETDALAGAAHLGVELVHLNVAHRDRAAAGLSHQLVAGPDLTAPEGAGRHGADALEREHTVHRQAGRALAAAPFYPGRRLFQGAQQLRDAAAVACTDRHDGHVHVPCAGQQPFHVCPCQLEQLVVDQIRLRQRDHTGRHAQQIDDRQVLHRLRHHPVVGGYHQQEEVDPGGSGDHGADEALVPGHVDHAEAAATGKLQLSVAELDGDAAFALLAQTVGVGAGEQGDECGLAVVDVTRSSEDQRVRVVHDGSAAERPAVPRTNDCGSFMTAPPQNGPRHRQ